MDVYVYKMYTSFVWAKWFEGSKINGDFTCTYSLQTAEVSLKVSMLYIISTGWIHDTTLWSTFQML